MTIDLEIADDLRVADSLAPVTIERTDGTPPAIVEHALRRTVITAEADMSGGKYSASDTVWHFATSALVEPPRLGDTIVDEQSVRWTVIAVDTLAPIGRWRCRARNLAIYARLDQQVTIERATWTQSPEGAPQAAWSLWRLNVAARIQPIAAAARLADARPQTRRRLQVYLAETLPLDHNHRIVHGGLAYRILESSRSDALDQLQTLTVEPVDTVGG